MRARIVLSSIVVSLLLSACGTDAPTPVTPKSAAVTVVDAGPDAGVDAGLPTDDGLGTSPSRPIGGIYDDDPTK
jgi:hypothetical protein